MAIKITLFIVFILLIVIFIGLVGLKCTKRNAIKQEYYNELNPRGEYGYGKKDVSEEKANKIKEKYNAKLSLNFIQIALFAILAIVMLVLTIIIPGNIHQVNTGEVAVVRHMGKVTGTREPGIYWDWYFTNDYEIYDTKVREINIETQTYSKDNQIIGVQADLQYTIDSAQVDRIATEYGSIDKLESKITSISLDNIKSVFAQNTATDVINNRSSISANISQTVDNSINDSYYVNVKTIVLTNIDFTDDFEAAVAAKVAQEQKKQQALIEQEQQLAQAQNDKAIAIAKAEAEAESARLKAEAEARVAEIQAEADKIVAQIGADSAEYQGRKQAAIALQKLASINGWTIVTTIEADGTQYNQLYKPDKTLVTNDELKAGVDKLLEVYKYEAWDGKLPVYQMGDSGTITVVQP